MTKENKPGQSPGPEIDAETRANHARAADLFAAALQSPEAVETFRRAREAIAGEAVRAYLTGETD